MIRGIGVSGVTSEIGALARDKLEVEYDKLVNGLCYRFEATKDEAIESINQALRAGVIKLKNKYVTLIER